MRFGITNLTIETALRIADRVEEDRMTKERRKVLRCPSDRCRRRDDVGEGQAVPRVGLEVGHRSQHQHQADTVGDRMMQLEDECAAAVCHPREDSQLPERTGAVERLTYPVLGTSENVAAFRRATEIVVVVVVVDIELIGFDPSWARTVVEHTLTKPGELGHHPLDGRTHALRRGWALEEPHAHHGRTQLRVLLDVPDQRIAAAHGLVVSDSAHEHLQHRITGSSLQLEVAIVYRPERVRY